MLGYGQGYPGNIGLLESIGTDKGAGHLPGDQNQWNRIHVGISDTGYQVGRPRA